MASPTVFDWYRSKIVNAPDSDWLWWTDGAISYRSERQSPVTTRHNSVSDPEQSTAVEVIAVPARLASLTAATAQPKARRAQLASARTDRSGPGRIDEPAKETAWLSQLHCSSPDTYRRKHTAFSKSSRATDRQATPQVLRDLKASGWRRAEGYPHVLALRDGFESAWLHKSSRVREEGTGRVGEVVMDGETAETLAVVVRLLQRAGQLASVRAEGEGPRSPRQLVALGAHLVAKEVRNLLPDGVDEAGRRRSGRTRSVCCGRRSSCYVRSPLPGCGAAARLGVRVADLVGQANTGAGA